MGHTPWGHKSQTQRTEHACVHTSFFCASIQILSLGLLFKDIPSTIVLSFPAPSFLPLCWIISINIKTGCNISCLKKKQPSLTPSPFSYWASLVAQLIKNTPSMQETQFDPWIGKVPWRRHGNPLQYCAWRIPMDRAAWRATVHAVTKNPTQLSDLAQYSTFYLVTHFSAPFKRQQALNESFSCSLH